MGGEPHYYSFLDASLALPASLTRLELSGASASPQHVMRQGVCVSADLPTFSTWKVSSVFICPQVLRGLTSLQHLELSSLHNRWLQPQQGYRAVDLLEVLQGFTRLRHLQLHDCGPYTVWVQRPPPLPPLLPLGEIEEQPAEQQQALAD